MSEENSKNQGNRIKVHRGRAFSQVPDDILTNKNMSPTARLTLGYLVGRCSDWVFYVGQVRRALGLSQGLWTKVRREMEAEGYLKQTRRHRGKNDKELLGHARGQWIWEIEVFDTPTIRGKAIDGKPINGFPIDGKPINRTEDFKQPDLNIEEEEREDPQSGSSLSGDASNPKAKSRAFCRKVLGDASWSLPSLWRDFAVTERPDLSSKQIDHLEKKFHSHFLTREDTEKTEGEWLATWKSWVLHEVVRQVQGRSDAAGAGASVRGRKDFTGAADTTTPAPHNIAVARLDAARAILGAAIPKKKT